MKPDSVQLKLTYYIGNSIIDVIQCTNKLDPMEVIFINDDYEGTGDSKGIAFDDIDELVNICNDAKQRFNKLKKGL